MTTADVLLSRSRANTVGSVGPAAKRFPWPASRRTICSDFRSAYREPISTGYAVCSLKQDSSYVEAVMEKCANRLIRNGNGVADGSKSKLRITTFCLG